MTDREKISASDTIVLTERREIPASGSVSGLPAVSMQAIDPSKVPTIAGLTKLPYLRITEMLPEQGAKSVVYGAYDTESKTNVVLKVSKKDRADMDVGETAGWVNETNLLEALSDTGAVVPFYTGGVSKLQFPDGSASKVRYIVMARQECSLATLIAQELPAQRRLKLFNELLTQVCKLHEKRYAHRDLKPKNVLVMKGGERLVLADLYSAGLIGMPADLTIEAGLWTLNYMAPEQLGVALQGLGPEVDVYALGVTLHELLTGRLPFERNVNNPKESLKSPLEIDPSLPVPIQRIIERACQRDPTERYKSAREFQRAFKATFSQ